MKRIMVGWLTACVAWSTAWGAGMTYRWNHSGTDWATPANWRTNSGAVWYTPATAPTAADTATFLNNAANYPDIAGAQAIYKVDCSVQQQNMTIGGSGPLTIGAGGIVGQAYNTVTFANTLTLNLGASQPWRPTSSHTIAVQGSVTGTGDITVDNAADTSCSLRYGYAPSYVTGATFTGNTTVNGSSVQRWAYGGYGVDSACGFGLEFGTLTADALAHFGTSGGNPATITLNAATFVIHVKATTSGNYYLAECDNKIAIGSGGGVLSAYEEGPGGSDYVTGGVAKWSGAVTLGGPLYLARDISSSTMNGAWNAGKGPQYTGNVSLKQDAAGRLSIAIIPPSYAYYSVNYAGAISDTGSGFRNPLILQNVHDTLTFSGPAASMTYANGTVVESCGSFESWAWGPRAKIDLASNSKLGTGNLTVLPGGIIRLLATGALAGTARIQSSTSAAGVLAITNDAVTAMSAISSDSSGVLDLDNSAGGSFTQISNLSTLGNGYMFLGSNGGGRFTGATLAPGAGNKYRLGGGMSVGALLMDSSVLTGDASLQVGLPKWQGVSSVTLNQSNDFTGDTDIYGFPVPNAGALWSSLIGMNISSGTPLGSASGAVHLHCGNLQLNGVTSGNTAGQSKGAVDFESQNQLTVDYQYKNATYLTVASLTRVNRGTLRYYPATPGGNARLLVISHPDIHNSIFDPYLTTLTAYGVNKDFAIYDATTGVQPIAAYETTPANFDNTKVASVTGALANGTYSVYALKVAGDVTGSGTINIGDTTQSSVAGLILNGNLPFDVQFGAAEGIIWPTASKTLSGKISGSNGLTIGYYSGTLTLNNVNNDFTGQITVNGGVLSAVLDTTGASGIGTSSLGPVTNPILLNGGMLVASANSVSNAGRTITLGVCGGTLRGTITADAKLTGPGVLMIYGGTVTVTGSGNDYQGGTRVLLGGGWSLTANDVSGTLVANAGALLGSGDLDVASCLTATLKGTNNLAVGAVAQVNTRGTLNFQAATPVIGGLTGSGDAVLGQSTVNDTTLTVGGGNVSSTFYGLIRQVSATAGQGKGSLTKTGSGTFTLYGAHTYTGPTTVNAGELMLMGSVASNLVVNTGGAIGGCGQVNGDLTVNAGGKFAVTLRSASDYDRLTVIGKATLNGSIEVTLAPGYTPPFNSHWTIATTGTASLNGAVTDGFSVRMLGNVIDLSNPPKGTLMLVM